MQERDRAAIAMHEYDALRAEIRAGMQNCFVLLGGSAVVLAAALAAVFEGERGEILLALPAILLAVVALLLRVMRGMEGMGAFLRELEGRMNDLAGERVLGWETVGSPALHLERTRGGFERVARAGSMQIMLSLGGLALYGFVLVEGALFILDYGPWWGFAAAAYLIFYIVFVLPLVWSAIRLPGVMSEVADVFHSYWTGAHPSDDRR